ncbi:hypothetical protein [Mycoplasmopsis mustelae]|nr:hypothetical protein [Mycoplasmopsis mustelae]
MVGIYALSLLICTCFIYFYKKVGKKYLPHLTKWINEFKYSSGDNFYLNGENEEIPEKEKLLVYFFNENKKKAYLGYNFMSYFNDEYEQQIKIFYFVIWGYHFKEINDGDIHYSDLYQSFLYNKNNKPKDDSFFDKLFKK